MSYYLKLKVRILMCILLHSALFTVSFYKALWTSGYTSRAIGWGNSLAGECVTVFFTFQLALVHAQPRGNV